MAAAAAASTRYSLLPGGKSTVRSIGSTGRPSPPRMRRKSETAARPSPTLEKVTVSLDGRPQTIACAGDSEREKSCRSDSALTMAVSPRRASPSGSGPPSGRKISRLPGRRHTGAGRTSGQSIRLKKRRAGSPPPASKI